MYWIKKMRTKKSKKNHSWRCSWWRQSLRERREENGKPSKWWWLNTTQKGHVVVLAWFGDARFEMKDSDVNLNGDSIIELLPRPAKLRTTVGVSSNGLGFESNWSFRFGDWIFKAKKLGSCLTRAGWDERWIPDGPLKRDTNGFGIVSGVATATTHARTL